MEVRHKRNFSTESSSSMAMSLRSENKSVRVMKPTFQKVQIIYYISKNGHLEHPHFIEVTHLAHHQLRLKDVFDRLTVLRGKGMPSLYSWSCKRSYKNGYVWNDLAENDVIYPCEEAEYVLKASQLIQACTENVEETKIANYQESLILNQKHKLLAAAKRHPEPQVYNNHQEDDEYDEKPSYNTLPVEAYSGRLKSRCSRGVSTEEIEPQNEMMPSIINPGHQLVIDNSSPPSTASSTNSEKANESNNGSSNRFEDGSSTGPWAGRGSILRQLIACGGGSGPVEPAVTITVRPQLPSTTAARKSSSLHKGVLCKTAARAEDEDVEMIKFMSENPRFGNVQAEDKEYFSGSIVEGVSEEKVQAGIGPVLQKSSSYNQERSSKTGLVEVKEEREEVEVKREKGVRGRCLPIKMSSSKQSKK